MRRRGYTPNDTRDAIRLLSHRYAGSARGRNRILLATVILCIVALTMVFGITRGKILPSMQRLSRQVISGRREDA